MSPTEDLAEDLRTGLDDWRREQSQSSLQRVLRTLSKVFDSPDQTRCAAQQFVETLDEPIEEAVAVDVLVGLYHARPVSLLSDEPLPNARCPADSAFIEWLRLCGADDDARKASEAADRRLVNPLQRFSRFEETSTAVSRVLVGPRVWRLLMRALWIHGGGREVHDRKLRLQPAISVGVHDRLRDALFTKQGSVQPQGRGLILAAGGSELASIPVVDDVQLDIMVRATRSFGTLTAHRLINYLVRETASAAAEERPSPTIHVFDGFADLARRIGARSNKAQTTLAEVVKAGGQWQFTWPGGYLGGLWTSRIHDSMASTRRAGRPSYVEIRLGPALAPHFVSGIPKGSAARSLMPVVEIPPLVPQNRTHGQQATLAMGLVRELVERRHEIANMGRVKLSEPEVARLAAMSGLDISTATRVIDRWGRDGDDGPAFITHEHGRFHLADNSTYGSARRFIDDTARRAADGRRRGRKSAKKRSRPE